MEPEKKEYNIEGYKRMALRIIITAIQEYRKGNEDDKKWIKSKGFDYWCNILEVSPDLIRKKIIESKGKITIPCGFKGSRKAVLRLRSKRKKQEGDNGIQ